MNAFEERMGALMARFRERAAVDRVALAQALAAGDRETVRNIAHKLAGVAGMLGHPEVTEAALTLEEAAEGNGDLADAARTLDRLLMAVENQSS